jgi:copper resistance protein C
LIVRFLRLLPLVAILSVSSSNIALAHAFPQTEEPPDGATVIAAPTTVSITFSESVDAHFSGIIVEDAQGRRADDGGTKPDPNNSRRLGVGLKQPVASGSYKVIWHALSADGHRTQGSYHFTVAH